VNARYFDWIWTVKGSLAIVPEQSNDEAFRRLDPLFRQFGTTYQRNHDTLTFRKKDQAAQDKMAVFDDGALQIQRDASGPRLHYRLHSRILLFCFLAPLMFLAFAQLTVYMNQRAKAAEAAGKVEKKPEKKNVVLTLNPVDKFLGAPAPEAPKKDEEAPGRGRKKPSPTSAIVLAAIFALLYVFGRIFEHKMVESLFRKSLQGVSLYPSHVPSSSTSPVAQPSPGS
jgi:hypothetical protein